MRTPKMQSRVLVGMAACLASLLFGGPLAAAGLYRCSGVEGPTFSDRPCGVDPQRVGTYPGLSPGVQDRATLVIDLELHQLMHDTETKYQLLQEASAIERARMIKRELRNLDHLVQAAEKQGYKNWPKGMSWN